jgi:hypothetical protein
VRHRKICPNCSHEASVSMQYVLSLGFTPIKCNHCLCDLEKSLSYRTMSLTVLLTYFSFGWFDYPKGLAIAICLILGGVVFFSSYLFDGYMIWNSKNLFQRFFLNLSIMFSTAYLLIYLW